MPEPLTLASQGNYWRFAQIARPGEPIVRLPKSWTHRRLGTTIKVAGWWGRVGRLRAALYAQGDEVWAQLGRQVIRLDPAVSVQHYQGIVRQLLITSRGAPVFASAYLRPVRSVFHWYDNWATEGDYDFGAYISEIAAKASDPLLLTRWPFERELVVRATASS